MWYLGSNAAAVHGPSLALAVVCLAGMRFYPLRWTAIVPPQIAAVVLGTLALFLIEGPLGIHTDIETIGSHFGANAIPNSLPMPHIPAGFSLEAVPSLLQPALTLALLAGGRRGFRDVASSLLSYLLAVLAPGRCFPSPVASVDLRPSPASLPYPVVSSSCPQPSSPCCAHA